MTQVESLNAALTDTQEKALRHAYAEGHVELFNERDEADGFTRATWQALEDMQLVDFEQNKYWYMPVKVRATSRGRAWLYYKDVERGVH